MPETNNHKLLRITIRPWIKAPLKKYTLEKDFLHIYLFTEIAYTVLGQFRSWRSLTLTMTPNGVRTP
jgi:hypothetical protein